MSFLQGITCSWMPIFWLCVCLHWWLGFQFVFSSIYHVASANRAFSDSFSSLSGQRRFSAPHCSGVCLTISISTYSSSICNWNLCGIFMIVEMFDEIPCWRVEVWALELAAARWSFGQAMGVALCICCSRVFKSQSAFVAGHGELLFFGGFRGCGLTSLCHCAYLYFLVGLFPGK